LILSAAAWNVALTSALAGLSNPMWLSLIWTKVKSSERIFAGSAPSSREAGIAAGEAPHHACASPLHTFQEAAPSISRVSGPTTPSWPSFLFSVICLPFCGGMSAAFISGDSLPRKFIPRRGSGIKSRRGASIQWGDFLCDLHLRETGENFYFGKDSVDTKVRIFELTMWPHMRAAYNLARWLVRNDHDAEDIVQESFMKAYKAQESFRGGESKTWMLSIVRNTAMDFFAAL
jgi:hypothetical protein